MLLRNHPLLNYQGVPSWPPVWTFTGGLENKRLRREEIGILTEVTMNLLIDASCISSTKKQLMSAAY